jgi:hypothetical protein
MSAEGKIKLLSRHGRAIVHMRQLIDQKGLGLVLGAGVSQACGLPGWGTLLERITAELESLGIAGRDISKQAAPVRAQILLARYRHYIERCDAEGTSDSDVLRARVASGWRNIVRDALYAGFSTSQAVRDAHPYAKELGSVALKVPIVVTYNFDDLLEQALAVHPAKSVDTVGYYSAWGSHFVVQDGRPVVYHPNGYIPFVPIDRYSEQVILTESALADQALDAMSGGFALLAEYYSKSPSLFLGFSLEDPAMRNMLRHATRRAPGVIHYYAKFCRGCIPTATERAETTETNFDLFNMVTLYLEEWEYPDLLCLLAETSIDEFDYLCGEAGVRTQYLYYLTGPVSVGKTTVLSRLQGVSIVDEWLEPRDPLIAKPSNQLTVDERNQVDEWILKQLRLKNLRFSKAARGLHVMDRAPLDAFAFTAEADYRSKAQSLYDVSCAGRTGNPLPFKAGALLLLTGRAEDLLDRQRWRGRTGTINYIENQQKALLEAYDASSSDNCTVIDTKGLSIEAVLKGVMHAIHVQPYVEYQVDARLNHFLAP